MQGTLLCVPTDVAKSSSSEDSDSSQDENSRPNFGASLFSGKRRSLHRRSSAKFDHEDNNCDVSSSVAHALESANIASTFATEDSSSAGTSASFSRQAQDSGHAHMGTSFGGADGLQKHDFSLDMRRACDVGVDDRLARTIRKHEMYQECRKEARKALELDRMSSVTHLLVLLLCLGGEFKVAVSFGCGSVARFVRMNRGVWHVFFGAFTALRRARRYPRLMYAS